MSVSPGRNGNRAAQKPGLGWRGLTLQLIFVTILPLTVLLILVAFGSINVHQKAMRALVGQRDERAVKTAAAALSAQVNQRIAAVQDFSKQYSAQNPQSLQEFLAGSSHLLRDFDGGVAIVDPDGNLLAWLGDRAIWEKLATGTGINLKSLYPDQPAQVFVSNAFPDPTQGGPLVAISSEATQTGSQPGRLAILGLFSPRELARSTLADAFATESQSAVLIFDASRQLLYQSGSLPADGALENHPGVSEALAGQSGTRFMPAEDGEHVVAFTPVAPMNWALVVEEPWEMVASPMLSYTQMAPLVLVPVLLFTLFALWFGIRQIVQPLQTLEEQADALAWGEYQAVEKPVGGIAEIRRLQQSLVHMSRKVQAAQQSLHGYIGAITAGQEEERRRLARELHDDTIQSLIALKQRVQLAQLNQTNSSTAQSFAELEELTEKTIDNLRRVTRALRPIYLEDLGLLAALEMLTGEMSQIAGIPIDFQASGPALRLPPKEELALYRIAQEALSNVARHAQATRASVHLTFHPDRVLLEVLDNGQGFEVPRSPADFAPGGHYGLLGLFERAELMGAALTIDSTSGKGTRVSVALDRGLDRGLDRTIEQEKR